MRRHAVVVLAAVAVVAGASPSRAADDAKEELAKKELKALKGAWKVISREVDGKKVSQEELKDVVVTRDEAGKFSARRGDMVIGVGTIKIDPTKKPKTMDVIYTEGNNKEKTLLGIYEFEGDSYRLCVAPPGAKRPTEFSAKAGSGNALMVYQREKK
jgi:uncharacterized protein (TIGR03067 family)